MQGAVVVIETWSLGTRCDMGQRVLGFLVVQFAAKALKNYYLFFRCYEDGGIDQCSCDYSPRGPVLAGLVAVRCTLSSVGLCIVRLPSL